MEACSYFLFSGETFKLMKEQGNFRKKGLERRARIKGIV